MHYGLELKWKMRNNMEYIELSWSAPPMSPQAPSQLTLDRIADLRLALSKRHGAERRSFAAEMTLKYCGGSARQAERVFGWGREMVETGLGEKRTGILCVSAKPCCTGNKRWEEKRPAVAEEPCRLAAARGQHSNSRRENSFIKQ